MHNSFRKETGEDFDFYALPNDKWDKIKDFLAKRAVQCFLNEEQIARLRELPQDKQVEELKKYYFPDVGNIKSGDFGEIFCYYFLVSEYRDKGISLCGPRKWIWKDNKNKAAPCADVLLFDQSSEDRTKHLLLTVESKMAATRPRPNKNRINDAIGGATEDKISRMAKTIIWLREKYHKENLIEERDEISRFTNPVDDPYMIEHFAIALFDSSFCEDEKQKETEFKDGIKVYVLSMDRLKEMYEMFYEDGMNAR